MKPGKIPALLLVAGLLLHMDTQAQGFLKKLKEKAEKKAEEVIDKKISDKTGLPSSGNSNGNTNAVGGNVSGSTSSGRNGRPSNKSGEGLKNTTPPDVLQQLTDADKAFSSSKYGDARFSVQQALLGVELQIGRQVLQSLPEKIGELAKDTAEDRVVSTRYGWANLTIQRVYQKGDKQLSVTIGNNPIYMGMIDLYFGLGVAQSNGETQNAKQIRVKGNKGIIKFDKDEGYTVLIQLGQSGMISWQGINYATEQEITDAVNQFDVDSIKKMLGE